MDKKLVYIGGNQPGQEEMLAEFQAAGYETILCLHTGQGEKAVDLTDAASVKSLAQHISQLDILVFDARIPDARDSSDLAGRPDWQEAAWLYDKYFIGFARLLHVLLPLMRRGGMKRICILTEACSSINLCRDTAAYGKHLALAAVNMFSKEMFNQLVEEGFTMRAYCADGDWDYIPEYFLSNRNYYEEELFRSDERRFVLRSQQGTELPW